MESAGLIVVILAVVFFLIAVTRHKSDISENRKSHQNTANKYKNHNRVTITPEPTYVWGRARVLDGDSIIIKGREIRLFGIDAPELKHPFGQKAKWALIHMCNGQTVNAELLEFDHYGRRVAKCTLSDGRDLSAEMVKLGLALDWKKFSGGKYRHLETHDARKKLWLADARQKGRMHVWEKFEASQNTRRSSNA